jgi:hypothetical protein
MAVTELPALTTGLGFTVKDLLADRTPHKPPLVVSVNVTEATEVTDAVYVVVLGVPPPLLVKDPPAPPSDQTAEVAPPEKVPLSAAVVPP